jgi:hypothetical protein
VHGEVCLDYQGEGVMSEVRKLVIVVSGGVVQNVMADKSMSDVEVHLLDYDNLAAGQSEPTVEQWVEVNPSQVRLVLAGQHEDQLKYLAPDSAEG